ncbi:hypothetical protein A4A49_06470 [Nicotiana attenuata]|uniref:Uncharacterized protein n=1 Tax=Nicotiana attenuata TaxID=49451 RepID=A0A314L6D9_NICAT|nr:hypothetical protein A4A49_06470 [Nicotiana attenuata]
MRCDKESPLFNCQMQDKLFTFKIMLLKVGGCDMVLGMDWIDIAVPVILHTRPHSLSFMKDGRMVTLLGVNEKPKLTVVDNDALSRMLHYRTGIVVAELSVVTVGPAKKKKEIMNPDLERLLLTYNDVFQEPTELPHERSCDHVINLIPGVQPFNLRPYMYSHDQKNTIESVTNDMIKAEIVVPSQSAFASPVFLVKTRIILGGYVWIIGGFSKVHLRAGYHQVRMRAGEEHNTDYATAIFQSLMNILF